MTQLTFAQIKDLGLQREVMDALPYAVVGGAWEGSLTALSDLYTAIIHVVPAGQQLKMLFLRVWTQNTDGAKFSIYQTNPAAGDAGDIESNPVVGSVPGATTLVPTQSAGFRDYPMLEAAGCETLRGSLRDPIHVFEGSITFNLIHKYPVGTPLTGDRCGIAYWGVEKIPE